LLFASAFALATPAVVTAQNSPALVDQISPSQGTMPQIRATSGSSASERVPVSPRQSAPDSPQRGAAGQLAAVPQEVIEACEGPESDRAAANGVDCVALLRALDEARRPPSAEQALLSALRPAGTPGAGSSQRNVRSTNADDVARQLSTGDVEGAGATEAIGAIRQQGAGPRS